MSLRRRIARGARRVGARRAPRSDAADGVEEGAGGRVVLLRCPTPTDYLCPCGAVARRLRKLGVAHRVERVPYRRSARPEVIELTDQNRVPVLIDGREVISDSKRIREHLDRVYGGGDSSTDGEQGVSGDEGRSEATA